jgi:signal transduction histidine kinase
MLADPATPPSNRPTVLILSTSLAFARELTTHWPSDSNLPEFTVLKEGLFRDLAADYDLAIADASSPDFCSQLKQALAAAGKPAILIHSESSLPFCQTDGTMIELRCQENGSLPALAGLLGREILGRSVAETRAKHAETLCAAAQAEATLGRYIAGMRHNVNNALTSILGNAELLTFETGLPANVLAQADTILNMALRLHEVFQRFLSIEKELSVAARESGKKQPPARAAVSGK